ncbi:hypothetical protein BVY04_01940 [bacterium M21]|nr:hypothetical protein BVY04_01940 [bacterium M21]
MTRCPGQDQRYWTPEDIFDVSCPYCANEIEFWKDEPFHICKKCMREVRNPRIDLGCAKWCKFADSCVGRSSKDPDAVAAPVVERLMALIDKKTDFDVPTLRQCRSFCCLADDLLGEDTVANPRMSKAGALLAGLLLIPETHDSNNPLPNGDESKLDDCQEMLERTNIEAEDVTLIMDLLKAVFVTRNLTTPESEFVWDLIQLHRLPVAEAAGKGHRISTLLRTDVAKAHCTA